MQAIVLQLNLSRGDCQELGLECNFRVLVSTARWSYRPIFLDSYGHERFFGLQTH